MVRDPVVYVVDDDDAARESMSYLLRSVGLEAEAFANPQEFLDAVDPDREGCAVLDLRLPELSGIEVMNRLREKGALIPVIIITAYGDVATAVKAIKDGAVDVLEKPVNDQVLVELIQKCIEMDRAQRKSQSIRREFEARVKGLTLRENEVLRLIVQGRSSKEVAHRRHRSHTRPRKNHRIVGRHHRHGWVSGQRGVESPLYGTVVGPYDRPRRAREHGRRI